MLNKYVIVLFAGLVLPTLLAHGQVFLPNIDAGFFAGASYYMGDVNPRRQFYRPGLSLGGLAKFNLTEFHTVRANAFWGQLSGDDLDFNNEYQQIRSHRFETTLLDVNIGYEFNFRPYIVKRRTKAHTPYLFVAVGYSLIMSSTTDVAKSHLSIPFGAGYKYRINDRFAIGAQWGWRKTFDDTIDGLFSPGMEEATAVTHNNDWYSFAGVYLTLKIFEKGYKCPGVKEPNSFK